MSLKRNNEDFNDLGFDDQSPKHIVKNHKLNNDFISLDEDEQEYHTFKLPVIKQDKAERSNRIIQKDKKQDGFNKRIVNDNQNDEDYYDYGNDFQDEAGDNSNNFQNNTNNTKMYQYQPQKQSLKGEIKTKLINQRTKQQSLHKNESKSNIQSQRINQSLQRTSVNNKQSHLGKFSSDVENNFPQTDISKHSEDQIQKLNQKVRGMIRNLNNELNQILNRVTLDQKKPIPTKRNVEQVLKVMIQTKKNNQKILDRGVTQLKKLNTKIGSYKGENYQQQIITQVITLTAKKKQLQKTIVQTKAGYSINQKRPVLDLKNIEILKTELFNLKKDVDKHQSKQNQLQNKLYSLSSKQNNVQRKHKDIVDKAHDKGIVISTAKTVVKQKQLEDKQKVLKKGIDSIEVLYKSKGDIINSENQRIKRQIVNCQAQIKDLYNQIVELAGKSALLIEKQKQNPKLMKNVLHSLEAFSRSIANHPIDYNSSSQRQLQSKSPVGTSRNLNNQIRTQSDYSKSPSKIGKHTLNQNKNSLKPNFKKGRYSGKVIEKQENIKQIETPQIVQNMEKQIEKVQGVVNNLKPTFNFRKRLESKSQLKDNNDVNISSPSPQLTESVQNDEADKVMKPFTRFRKASSNNGIAQSLIQPKQQNQHIDNIKNKQILQELQQQPRRFTLRRRGNNNEQSQAGYNPSIGRQDNSTPSSQRYLNNNEQQKTKLLSQQPQNKAQHLPTKSLDYHPSQQALPVRKRNVSKQSQHVQQQHYQQKSIQNIKPIPSKQKQGRLKKQKINIQPQKISHNIYSEAQDLTIKESNPISPNKRQQSFDLNGLIGNKKKLTTSDDELQFNDKKVPISNNTKNRNKQDDFFGFDV